MPMKVILADDHALFREGLRLLLQRLDKDVFILEADNHDAVLKLLAENPDAHLALVDLHMPGRSDDLSALAEVLKHAMTIPVVVLSGSENMDEVHQTINAGAMGFIPKYEHSDVLLCALQLVLSGGVYVPPMLVSRAKGDSRPQVRLTAKQFEVLQQLCKGYSNKEIGRNMHLSEPTVKCHVSGIFRELNVENRMQAANAAKQLGLIS
jgi:DNA-binding NarL/FixJ family response regulator